MTAAVATYAVADLPVAADPPVPAVVPAELPCLTHLVARGCETADTFRLAETAVPIVMVTTAHVARVTVGVAIVRGCETMPATRAVGTAGISRMLSGPAHRRGVGTEPYAVCPPNPSWRIAA